MELELRFARLADDDTGGQAAHFNDVALRRHVFTRAGVAGVLMLEIWKKGCVLRSDR